MDTLQTPVTLCGRLADTLGPVVSISVPAAGCSASDLRAGIALAFPALALAVATTRVRVCVDDAIVGDDHWVTPDQMIALFPPVSGG